MSSVPGRGFESLRRLVTDPDLASSPSPVRRRPRPLPVWVLGVWLACLTAMLVACASTSVRIRLAPLMVDPATADNDARWAGAAALVGIMAWTASATALLIAGHALRGTGKDARRARLLTDGGIVLVALAVDDALLLHEYWVPRLTGAPDVATYLVLVAWVGVLAVRHRSELRSLPVTPLLMIGVAFAASLSLDVLFDVVHPLRAASAIEDTLKLFALVLLAVVCIREALAATTPARSVLDRDGATPAVAPGSTPPGDQRPLVTALPDHAEGPREETPPEIDLTDRPPAPRPAPTTSGFADSRG